MKSLKLALLPVLFAALALVPLASAQSVDTYVLTPTAPTQCASDLTPPSATTFSATDTEFYLWFFAKGVKKGDVFASKYYTPSNTVYTGVTGAPAGSTWSAPVEDANYCFTDLAFKIAGTPVATTLGDWHVDVTVNGFFVFRIVFTIKAAPGGGGTTPTAGNLLQNGDAESSAGSSAYTGMATIPGWVSDGNATVALYEGSGDYLTLTSPGPANRGKNFFGGGYVASSKLTQTINLSASAAQIDLGTQPYTLDGWFGGYSSQGDNAVLKVTFKSATATLGTAIIGPVTPTERGNVTSLIRKTATGKVPAGARTAEVSLEFTRTDGSANDGYADSLYFGLDGSGGATFGVTLTPATATNPVGTTHTVSARVADQAGNPQAGITVSFSISSGPNAGATGVCSPAGCKTDSSGQVSFTYTGSGGAGQDSISACVSGQGTGSQACCSSSLGTVTDAMAFGDPAPAAAKSSKVVIIGAATVSGTCSSGAANVFRSSGCLSISDKGGDLAGITFAGLDPTAVTAAALAGYDTAVLNVGSSVIACNLASTGKLSAQAKADLVSFVAAGKKLIIYDSECTASGGSGMDYSWLPYPFTTANPGAMGAQGTLNIVENSSLGSSVSGSPYFVDAADLSKNTDAVGDMNVMTTRDSHWCLSMSGTNALKVTGPVHAYAKYPAGTDSGLIVYNGLDQDNAGNSGNANLRKIWALELQQPFSPSNLPCGVAVVGITLTPATATNPPGTAHTVTAKVVDQLGQPQPNTVVSFSVTAGPNKDASGACNPGGCKTDNTGQVTFTYTGSGGLGQDSIQACFTPAGGTPVCATPVNKTWATGGTGSQGCATPVTKTWVTGGTTGPTTVNVALTPATASNPVGTAHTVTARVTDPSNIPQANIPLTFTIVSGPNAGASGTCNPANCRTDSSGQVTFTYSSAGGPGQDSIRACVTQSGSGSQTCCSTPLENTVAAAAVETGGQPPAAAKSVKVAIIGAATVDPNCSSGANRVTSGGCLPITGAAGEIGDFNFSGLDPVAVSALSLAPFDTAVLNVASSGMGCNTGKLSAQAKSDLVAFVGSGKKLIIYDSECKASGSTGMDYSWLPYPFTTANPGAMGAHGTLNIVENSTLGSSVSGSPYYVDAANLSNNTDAVGDMNVMTTRDAHWCLSMSGTNYLKVTGPVHAYAKYPAGTDSGLIIYNGLDTDNMSNSGNANLRKIWLLELQQPFNTSNLPCGVAVVGITLSPATATNPPGTAHTVTSRVVDQLAQPQPNTLIGFSITAGPNKGASGSCSPANCQTDSKGQVTFTYTGSGGLGQDTIQACFTPAGAATPMCAAPVAKTWATGGGGGGGSTVQGCSTTVTKTWVAQTGCNYYVNPLSKTIPGSGGGGFVQIIAAQGCRWNAWTAPDSPWINITAGTAGNGGGAVSYEVPVNPTQTTRVGTINIANQVHTVTQDPGPAQCAYTLSPASATVPWNGATGSLSVSTGSACQWIATTTESWVSIAPLSGTGPGAIGYTVQSNAGGLRTAKITVSGQVFTISQDGNANAPVISSGGIVNAGSFSQPANQAGGEVGQGSLITIYGANIGPVQYVKGEPPYGTTLAGVGIKVTGPSGTAVDAYPVFVSATQINAILRSDTPVGDDMLTVTFNGVTSAAALMKVAPTGLGAFTWSGAQGGAGIIQIAEGNYPVQSTTKPHKPGQIAILWATGMGPINKPDNDVPGAIDLKGQFPTEVIVGGKSIPALYAGRAPEFPGVDNIYFVVPIDAPLGCTVPVEVKVAGVSRPPFNMAISRDGSPCQ